MSRLTLADADRIADVALAEGRSRGFARPVAGEGADHVGCSTPKPGCGAAR